MVDTIYADLFTGAVYGTGPIGAVGLYMVALTAAGLSDLQSILSDGKHAFVLGLTAPGSQAAWYGLWADEASLSVDTATVPEPASLLLLGTGLVGVVRAVRKRRG